MKSLPLYEIGKKRLPRAKFAAGCGGNIQRSGSSVRLRSAAGGVFVGNVEGGSVCGIGGGSIGNADTGFAANIGGGFVGCLIGVALLALLVLLCACTGSPPEIVGVEHSIVFRYDSTRRASVERLHLYALISDADGISDIDEIYIIHDDRSVFWKLTEDNWDLIEFDDATWIGSSTLRVPQADSIPRGRYRLQVYDQAGELGAREIGVFQNDTIESARIVFPELDYSDGTLRLISEYADNMVMWRYNNGSETFEYSGGAGEIDLRAIAPQLSGVLDGNIDSLRALSQFYIYAFPAGAINNNYYILVGPISI